MYAFQILHILTILILKIFDISQLPPELALQIFKNLNATDLCLAACVWKTLANAEILWSVQATRESNTTSLFLIFEIV